MRRTKRAQERAIPYLSSLGSQKIRSGRPFSFSWGFHGGCTSGSVCLCLLFFLCSLQLFWIILVSVQLQLFHSSLNRRGHATAIVLLRRQVEIPATRATPSAHNILLFHQLNDYEISACQPSGNSQLKVAPQTILSINWQFRTISTIREAYPGT